MKPIKFIKLVVVFQLLLLPLCVAGQSKQNNKSTLFSTKLKKAEGYYNDACREWKKGNNINANEYKRKAKDQADAVQKYANTPEEKNKLRKLFDKLNAFPPKINIGPNTPTIASSKWKILWDEQSQSLKLINGSITFAYKMIQVEGGEYDAKPILDFSIGETEVTELLWNVVMKNGFSSASQKPVTNVSWEECNQFVDKLNEITDLIFRLPDESEWTYAANGGNKSEGYVYAGSNNLIEVANTKGSLATVKQKRPNELGLYDMTGNVYEWTSTPSEHGSGYKMKGGSFLQAKNEHLHKKLRNISSDNQIKTHKGNNIGFRIVKSYE